MNWRCNYRYFHLDSPFLFVLESNPRWMVFFWILFQLHLPWASGPLIILIWLGSSFIPESKTMNIAISITKVMLVWEWWWVTSSWPLKTLDSHHPDCAPSPLWSEPSLTPFRTRPWWRKTALFIVAKIWKKSSHLSKDDWINKLWYILTASYYSLKINVLLIYTEYGSPKHFVEWWKSDMKEYTPHDSAYVKL